MSQCYAYDGFNRLGSAWTDTRSADTCEDDWSEAVQPSGTQEDLAYAIEYAYESTGEVQSITDLLATANATSTYAYTDPSSLNAVTAVTGGATSSSFDYDSAGRMTSRIVDAAAMGLVWDVSSNLVATTGQSSDRVYVYDASGQRVAQLKVGSVTSPTPQSATVYLGATEATDADTATAGNVSATRFYAIGGATVGTATATPSGPAQWALLLGDVQGSAQVSMELEADTGEDTGFAPADEGEHAVTRNAYEPYGARRGADALVTALLRGAQRATLHP